MVNSNVSFLKLAIMIEHIKIMQIPHLDIWSMLLSGEVPQQAATQVTCLKDPASVLAQTQLYRRKITYHPLAFFIN